MSLRPGPPIAPRRAREVHGLVANALLIFAGVHAVAALAHHYIFRDRTLVRMLAGGRTASAASTSAIADKLK
jgi:cytochrome b561